MRKQVIILTAMLACISLGGCVSQGKIGTLPIVENQDTASTVYIFRYSTAMGAGLSYTLCIDQQDFAKIASGNYTKIQLDSGPHVLSVKYPRQMFLGTAESSLEFNCNEGRDVYLMASPGLKVHVESISKSKGKQLMQKYKFFDVQ